MLRYIRLFIFCFLCGSISLAAEDMDDTPLGFSVGYRNDNFSRKARSKLLGANFIRQESYKDVSIVTYGANFATYNQYNVYIRGKLNYGQVIHLNASVKTPLLDLLHLKHNHNPRGNTYDGELAVGFPVFFWCQDFHFIPLVGYNYDRLKLRSKDHLNIDINTPLCLSGNIRNRITIQGPFVGIDFIYQCCWLRFYGSYEFQWGHMRSNVHYHTTRNFIYRGSNRSHHGFGNTVLIGMGWQFSTEWEIAFGLRYKNWHSSRGHHETVFKTPTNTFKSHAKIKNVDWNSYGITVDLILRY
jgi:hypothetical protein